MMAPAENQALYLFYLTAAESAADTEAITAADIAVKSAALAQTAVVDDRAPTFAHRHSGLAALLGVVAVDEFCGPEAERKLADLGWVGERALRHERVIEEGFRRGPVLPARFGTLFFVARGRGALHGSEPANDRRLSGHGPRAGGMGNQGAARPDGCAAMAECANRRRPAG